MTSECLITKTAVSLFTVPTDAPEGDGTLCWKSTTMVLVRLGCGKTCAIGYTYADAGTATVAQELLKEIVLDSDAMQHANTLQRMLRHIRNLGETGIAMMAVSAIDNALWDLRARLVDLPLVSLLGQVRSGMPVYGSGGFTSYTDQQLANQLGGWANAGFTKVKMKMAPTRSLTRRELASHARRLARIVIFSSTPTALTLSPRRSSWRIASAKTMCAGLKSLTRSPHGILPRSRTYRTHALRRLLRTCAGLHGSGSLPPRYGIGVERKGREPFPGLTHSLSSPIEMRDKNGCTSI